MAKVCQITGQKPRTGNKVSYSNRKSKRRFMPNLHTKKVFDPVTGRTMKIKVSSRGLRTATKRIAKGQKLVLVA